MPVPASHDIPGCAWIPEGDPRYPRQLAELSDRPPAICVRGDPAVLALPQLAIVGSRQATRGG